MEEMGLDLKIERNKEFLSEREKTVFQVGGMQEKKDTEIISGFVVM